jgi:hypothetical protein
VWDSTCVVTVRLAALHSSLYTISHLLVLAERILGPYHPSIRKKRPRDMLALPERQVFMTEHTRDRGGPAETPSCPRFCGCATDKQCVQDCDPLP